MSTNSISLTTGNSHLWQWDTGQTVTVSGNVEQVHFARRDLDVAYVASVTNGMATIPDALLQQAGTLIAYAYTPTNTLFSARWRVWPRQKPETYPYQDTVVDLKTIDDRFVDMKEWVKTQFGTPLTASTAAGMTDTSKVYVYTGSETGYTNGNWYYWDGTDWTSGGIYNAVAFTTDDTLSEAGEAADAAAVGAELGNLKSELEAFTDCEIILSKTFTTNTKNTNDWITTGLPVLEPSTDYYAYLIAVENVNVSTHPYLYINNTYTSGSNVQTPINNIGKYTKIAFDNTREYHSTILNLWKSETTLSEPVKASWVLMIVKGTPQSVFFEGSISRIDDEINAVENAVESNGGYLLDWSNNIYFYGSGVIRYANNRIGITVAVIAKSNIQVSIAQGYKYAVFRFSSTTPSTETEISNTGWLTSDHMISKDDIFLINIAKVDDSAITSNDGQKITMISFMSRGAVNSDYVIMADMLKHPVSTNQIGSVKYAQSFCVYNGKYYSTDGSNISEQDTSFNVLRDVGISLGHGNALQLGNGKYAYASGWDDNKIYVVDLDNLEVVNIITLPTTGYTTCVVDDLNKLAFVFQRDSFPDTVENYNFIIYDYDNQEIKSQRVINAFGAMQAADYYNGKIIITWGTGTVELPSGMAIYNTSGDILAEYNLSIFSTSEPEGVCFSRESEKLLIGIWNVVYEIRGDI